LQKWQVKLQGIGALEYLGWEDITVVLVDVMVKAAKQEGSSRFSVIVGARMNNCA